MQSAGARVKALKLEQGKDLKLQASGIWTQLWDQNCDTCNHQLPTPRTKRVTKAQIADRKHHQMKRFLQDHVLSHSLLWEAPFNFLEFGPGQVVKEDTPWLPSWKWQYGFTENPLFCPTPVLSMWTKFLSEETEEDGPLRARRGVLCPPFPIHIATLNWLETCKAASHPLLPMSRTTL